MGQLSLHFLAGWLNVCILQGLSCTKSIVCWQFSAWTLAVTHKILPFLLFISFAYWVCIAPLCCLLIFDSSFPFQLINSNIPNDQWAINQRMGRKLLMQGGRRNNSFHLLFMQALQLRKWLTWRPGDFDYTLIIGWKESSGHLSKPCMTHYFPFH